MSKLFVLSAVVEMMAAGLVTLAHRSGGPLMDIVVEEESSRNGFLASHDQVKLGLSFLPPASLLVCCLDSRKSQHAKI